MRTVVHHVFLFVILVAFASPAWPQGSKYRVDTLDLNVFSKEESWSEGEVFFDSFEKADKEGKRLKLIGGVTVKKYRVVPVVGELEIVVPKELDPDFPKLDKVGNPIASNRNLGDTLKEYKEQIERMLRNITRAEILLSNGVAKLTKENSEKFNELVRRYNEGVDTIRSTRHRTFFSRYRKLPEMAPEDFQKMRQKVPDEPQVELDHDQLRKEVHRILTNTASGKELTIEQFRKEVERIMRDFEALHMYFSSESQSKKPLP